MSAISKEEVFKQIGYIPHRRQVEFHNSSARFRVPCCGRRFGKSTMAGRDLEPQLFTPNKRFWIVGPTYDLGEKEFRIVWDDLIIGQKLGHDKRVKKRYNKKSGDMYIEFPWQTRLEVRSAQHPETLVGEALDGVIMSEAAKHHRESWERFIRPSLSDKRGWATFPTTPEGHNWLYQLWLLGLDSTFPDYASWKFPSWDNNAVYPGGRQDPEIVLIERTSPSTEWFMQEIGADFASFVGKIYSEFDEMSHVKSHTFNPAWPNYIAFDWGYANPLAAIEFQVDPWDNIYVWREHYLAYHTLEDHLAIMHDRIQPAGYSITCCFGDAADPEAAAYVTRHLAPCIVDPAAKSNWVQGVNTVKRFLKLRQTGEADEFGTPIEEPKMFFDPACQNIIREINNYKTKEARTATNPRELPQGLDDHALDALRYALVHLFELGAQHHLSDLYTSGHDVPDTYSFDRGSGLLLASQSGSYFSLDKEF